MTTPPTLHERPEASAPVRFEYKSRDGLLLAGQEWRPNPGNNADKDARVPVLCLAGLSRNSKDFLDVAGHLQACGHRVIALDYRGRGQSSWDPDWQNYSLPVEAGDIADALTHLDLDRFAIIGTSRGGLHAMAMAAQPGETRLAGVILNDIGPHIEMKAIQRLASTIGKTMEFPDQAACSEYLRQGLKPQFPAFGASDWLRFANQVGTATADKFVLEYDPALAKTLAVMDDGTPLPDLWPLFETMSAIPLLVIRGEHSDLLSAETCEEMLARHPNARAHIAAREGHAPMLWDDHSQTEISEFLRTLS